MDILGRVLIPKELREPAGFRAKDKVGAMINITDQTVTFYKSPDGEYDLDSLHRVVVPKAAWEAWRWSHRDKFNVTLQPGKTIQLSMAETYEPKCVFCSKQEETLTYRDQGICNDCLSVISPGHREG